MILILYLFLFNDSPTTENYTLSLHDALPISAANHIKPRDVLPGTLRGTRRILQWDDASTAIFRSEEHTSELQSRVDLVCRLLLEKKKNKFNNNYLYS